MDFKRLCSNIERELSEISERGLNSNNLDSAYKLMTMYKDIKKVESGMYDKGGSYSDGFSRHRDSARNTYRGDLGDKYNSYLDSKSAYRSNGTYDAKKDVVHKLEEYMDSFTSEMEDMLRDSDSPEERQTIQRYLNKIRTF